eukprot:CAMPEP_0172079584 /NCGR_PEP_ID=MMETSP1043-20130122/18254_1 /TAXON_ID=464988 /ORGANISM="Hemiselmis andersenii, Strain CCMP441" /LENGTH=42 /DNA_ID= /DNA_START= /DNA_END= /DNA_ORIENTATION=
MSVEGVSRATRSSSCALMALGGDVKVLRPVKTRCSDLDQLFS